jgi:hypothetical protein
MLIAGLVPAGFWISAIAVVGYALGRPIATAILVGCGLAIAACCLVAASAVIGASPSEG